MLPQKILRVVLILGSVAVELSDASVYRLVHGLKSCSSTRLRTILGALKG
jgi:hypothetical protein